jgi:DNA-binding LytR/AlgR family response regulator
MHMHLDINTRILLVEDNPGFIQLLEILLRDIGFKQIQIAQNYEAGQQAFKEFQPDICILDIDLGKGLRSGIQLAEYIRQIPANLPIIYLTSNYTEDYYQLTRHTKPSSFLNKELSRFKLEQAIDIALMHRNETTDGNHQTTATMEVPVITHQQCFFKIGDIYKAIPIKEIMYFYADNKLTYARVGVRNYPTNVQLKTLEDEFPAIFARIHKTYLVNVEHISAIHPKEGTVVVNNETLPIGYTFKNAFLRRLNLLR